MKKALFLVTCCFLLFSCKTKKQIIYEPPEANEYIGTWTLIETNVDSWNQLLNMGLVFQITLMEDGNLELCAVVDSEKNIMNEGVWHTISGKGYAEFSLPDHEYGGEIQGTLTLRDDRLYYKANTSILVFK